jgi:hypothetical protein
MSFARLWLRYYFLGLVGVIGYIVLRMLYLLAFFLWPAGIFFFMWLFDVKGGPSYWGPDGPFAWLGVLLGFVWALGYPAAVFALLATGVHKTIQAVRH